MKINNENKFKDRYVLGEGYPWIYERDYYVIGLNQNPIGISRLKLDMPNELWSKDVPKYKLVLERIQ